MAAFIPLNEFADPVIMKKYGVKSDPETLDILGTVAAQKEVTFFSYSASPYSRAYLTEISNFAWDCIY